MFSLEINNYRSFINEKFNFSRVNILIGENSSGKSSLLKFLLALKQTLDNPNESNLKLTGDLTDLGNFEEAIYYRQKNRRISFKYEVKEEYYDFYIKFLERLLSDTIKSKKGLAEISKCKNYPTQIKYAISSKLQDHSSIVTHISNTKLGSIQIIQRKNSEQTILRQRFCDIKFDFGVHKGTLEECDCSKRGFQTLVSANLLKLAQVKFGDELGTIIFIKITFLLIVQNFFYESIDKIRFVNPIGSAPKRLYFREDRKSNFRSIDIEKLINILGDPLLSPKVFNERLSRLNKAINEFGIAEEVNVIKDKQLPVIGLNVKTKNYWSNITDVGYGVSLQLPIIFQAIMSEFYTRTGETLLIEQPEVHLHPSLQAKFIETLLGLGKKNSYFIETHSEHIIRKLQLIIKNNEHGIKPEDVSIHYFKRIEGKFVVTSHSINEFGRLDPLFPDGFYDVSYSLVKQLL